MIVWERPALQTWPRIYEASILSTGGGGGGGGRAPHRGGGGGREGLRIWKGWGCSSSRLGCSGQNTIISSRKILCYGCTRRNIKKLYVFNSLYLLDSSNQSLKWSLLGVKKGWATPRSVFLRGLIQNFRRASPPLSYAESPPPGLKH